jgi:uncharacterized membrane protein YhaH (DUF805 family)
MHWYLDVLRKYAVFSGRARRREYWIFLAVNVMITIMLIMIDAAVGTFDAEIGVGLLSGVYTFAVLIPSLAVGARRLHDTDRTGWWLLISFIPVVGPIVLLVFLVLRGQIGPNRFGPNPRDAVVSLDEVPSTATP